MLIDQIQSDLKQFQLQRQEAEVSTLRMLLSEIRYAQIGKGKELSDADIVAVIQKEVKKRKEAAEGFRQGGRLESAAKEEKESEILQKYLPTQLSDEELTKIVENSINDMGAKTVADMGKVIGAVMSKVAGQAEGARVSALVKQKLSS